MIPSAPGLQQASRYIIRKTAVGAAIGRDARLTRLPHRTLMIWGREDRAMPLDMAFLLLRQIPVARLYVIPKCGHWAQWEHADEFNATALQFFGAPA